jgi:hypothetical protein
LSTLRIGAIEYALRYETPCVINDEIVSGYADATNSSIHIDSGLEAQQQFVTLWHETLHRVMDQAGIVTQEEVIDALANSIAQVLRDNRKLRGDSLWT